MHSLPDYVIKAIFLDSHMIDFKGEKAATDPAPAVLDLAQISTSYRRIQSAVESMCCCYSAEAMVVSG